MMTRNAVKVLLILLLAMLLAGPASCDAAPAGAPRFSETMDHAKITASWPDIGIPEADRYSRRLVARWTTEFRMRVMAYAEDIRGTSHTMPSCEQQISAAYAGNRRVGGLLWAVYEYLGGAHGSLVLTSCNYDRLTGKRIGLEDLFRRPDKALELFSILACGELLDRGMPPDMVRAGTSPQASNFRTFLLAEKGLTLYFEPYQVAPWAQGAVKVYVPVDALWEAGPRREYWR